jgi:ATP-binding protein involved in chromosome partitioning
METNETPLLTSLGEVVDPELMVAIGPLGYLRGISVKKNSAEVTVAFPIGAWPTADEVVGLVRQKLTELGYPGSVVVQATMTDDERLTLRHTLRGEMEDEHEGHHHSNPSPKILKSDSSTRILGISSGKGGVGKSSVTVNLAIALSKLGKNVAILDADVYGFSIPKMLGCDHDPVVLADMVIPTATHGVRCLSMGFFVPEDQPVIWRGPMLHKTIEQFFGDAFWGPVDFILIDMPPGTGDVALTLSQVVPKVEIYVVTTPQKAAQRVAQRSAYAARKLKLSVRGVIENMSHFTGDDGKRYELFGSGGGAELAAELEVPLLAQIPLVTQLREGGDDGHPIAAVAPESEAGAAFHALAAQIVAMKPKKIFSAGLKMV